MKNKIQDILNGKISRGDGLITAPEERISLQATENEELCAGFLVNGSDGASVRGYVTCDSSRVTIPDHIFSGKSSKIGFTYDPSGRTEGHSDSGRFVIHSDAGEYVLPFDITVTRRYFQTSIGTIKTLNDFANLCRLNWDEAKDVFISPDFPNLINTNEGYYSALREGLLSGSPDAGTAMDEFLAAVGKKERSSFDVQARQINCMPAASENEYYITITRSDWGYPGVRLSCESPFVELKKKRLSSGDFVGMKADVPFRIVPEKMHPGKNTAYVTVENGLKRTGVVITSRRPAKRASSRSDVSRQRTIASLEKKYLDFRTGKLPKADWEKESDRLLSEWMDLDRDGILNRLVASYIYIICDREDEAEKLLCSLSKKIVSGSTPLAAFYIFLNSYFESSQEKKESLSVVRSIYLRYPDEPLCAWILLQFDDALERNPERRFNMIKEYAVRYSTSPLFYLEAALVLRETPSLLHRQDVFEDRLIVWMSRKDLLSPSLASRIMDISSSKKEFNLSFFRVMIKCNRILRDDAAVKAVCAYLVRLHRYGGEYFPWYARGVELHLRIAGLYEAYMLSFSHSDGRIPKEILKYFLRGCHLPPEKRAMLYTYALSSDEVSPADKAVFTAAAQAFAAAELKKLHLKGPEGSNVFELAMLCRQLEKALLPLEWFSIKYDIDSCCRIRAAAPGAASVIIRSIAGPGTDCSRGRSGQYRLSGGEGYAYIYETPCLIFIEDDRGVRRLAEKDDVSVINLMTGEEVDFSSYSRGEETSADKAAAAADDAGDEGAGSLLLRASSGTNEEMLRAIEAASESGEDVLEYEKDLLDVMLFTDCFPRGHEKVFRDILSAGGAGPSVSAYAVRFAEKWVLGECEITEDMALFLKNGCHAMAAGRDIIKAALLKWYFKNPTEEGSAAEEILKDFLFRDMYFPFYESAPKELLKRYFISDIKVLICTGKAGQRLHADVAPGIGSSPKAARRKDMQLPLKEVLPGVYTACLYPAGGEELGYALRDEKGEPILEGSVLIKTSRGDSSSMALALGEALRGGRGGRGAADLARLLDMTGELFKPVNEQV